MMIANKLLIMVIKIRNKHHKSHWVQKLTKIAHQLTIPD